MGGRVNNKEKYSKLHADLDHLNAKRWKLVQNSFKSEQWHISAKRNIKQLYIIKSKVSKVKYKGDSIYIIKCEWLVIRSNEIKKGATVIK